MASTLEFDAPSTGRTLEFDAPATNAGPREPYSLGSAFDAYKNYLSNAAQDFIGLHRDAGAGIIRGAGSIGATILAPYDMAMDASQGGRVGVPTRNQERRQQMDAALRTAGADTDSGAFELGKLGAEIAGTSGAGRLIAKGVEYIPMLSKLAPVIESGGFNLGAAKTGSAVANLGLRTIGGATVGGAAAGLINPESADTGAMIGGAIPGGVKVAGGVGKLLGAGTRKAIGGLTGVGDEAFSTAVKAGKEGNRVFADNMRGKVDMTDVLDDAKAALDNMRIAKNEAYNSGMLDIRGDKSILGFDGIDKALKTGFNRVSFKGKVVDQKASGYLDEVMNAVDEWKSLNPGEFHTPSGMDALKQKIGATLESVPFEQKNARAIIGEIYNSVKNEITKQAPKYAEVMRDYSKSSELIGEIQKSLVGGKRASADTAMRKLQSLMRNNVNTNYGNRLNLARELETQGGKGILPAIAGQAVNEWMPRGLARMGQAGIGIGSWFNPAMALLAPLTSPRLMGEAAYGLGRMSGGSSNALSSLLAKSLPPQTLQALAQNPSALRTIAPTIALTAP